MSGGKGGSNQQVAYYYLPIAFAICEGPIVGIKRMWAGGNLIFSDDQPVAVNTHQGGGKKSGPTVSTSYQSFGSNTANGVQTGGSALGSWTCYLGNSGQPADPTIGEGVGYEGIAYIVFPALNIGPGATVPPLTFEVVTQGAISPSRPMWEVAIPDSSGGLAFDGDGNPLVGFGYDQSQYGFMKFSAADGSQIQNYVQGTMPFNFSFSNGFAGLSQPNGPGTECYSIVGGKYVSLGYSPNAPQPYYNGYSGAYEPNGGLSFGPSYPAGFPGGPVMCDGSYLLYTEQDDGGYSHMQCVPVNQFDINPLLQIETAGFFGNFSPFGFSDLCSKTQYFINGAYYALSILELGGPTYSGGLYKLQVGNFGANDSEYPVLVSNKPSVFGLDEDQSTFWIGYTESGNNYIQQMDFDGNLLAGTQFSVPSLPQYIYSAYGVLFLITFNQWDRYSRSGKLLEQFTTSQNYNLFANTGDGTIYAQSNNRLGRIAVAGSPIVPGPLTLPAAVTVLCERAGITEFDVSQLPATEVNFVRTDTVNARAMLQRLSQAYFFMMVDSGGTLKFIPQGLSPVATIPLSDLGYGSISPSGHSPYTSSRVSGVDLPRSVKIRYVSPALNWNRYEQIFALESYDSGKEITLDLPLILDDQTAYNIASMACTLPHAERAQYAFTTSLKWISLEAGDVVALPFGVCRILTVKMGSKNNQPVINFTACIDGINALSGAGYARPALPNYQPGQQPQDIVFTPPPSSSNPISPSGGTSHPVATAPQNQQTVPNAGSAKMVLCEPPPLNSADTGMRFYAGAYSTGNVFPGAGLFQSTDGGVTYNQIATYIGEETTGYANTALPAPSGPYNNGATWDNDSTVEIYLLSPNDTLSGLPDLNVLNGANTAMLGSELIQFAQATLQTDSFGNPYYMLSRLLRGRKGTEWAMGSHQQGESFYLVPGATSKITYAPELLNTPALYKVAMMGANLGNLPSKSYEPSGASLMQWAVAHPQVASDSSGDWTISWIPRSRYNGGMTSGYTATLDSDTVGWSIDVLSGMTVKRTINVPLSSTYPWQVVYTAAEQQSDGFSPGQSGTTFDIYQLSASVGRGYQRSITT